MIIPSTLAVAFTEEDNQSPIDQVVGDVETKDEGQEEEQNPIEEYEKDSEQPEKEAVEEESPQAEPKEKKETEKSQEEPVEEDNETGGEEENIPGGVGALRVGPLRNLGNIFTFESLTIGGELIGDGDIITIQEGTIAQINFKWNTEGKNAQSGDTAEIQLSDAFKIVTTPAQDIVVDGIVVGTYNIDEGVLKFEFNQNIENDDVQNGFVNLGLEFNLEKFRQNIEQEIPFHDNSDQNITVIARPNVNHSGIEKEGHPDSKHDAREITWTIDVINTNDEKITGTTVKDIIPEGLKLQEDSFVINKITLNYDGKKIVGDEFLSTPSIQGNEFEFEFDSIEPFKGYQIKYTTTIEDYSKDTFKNNATFSYNNKKLPADATVGGLTRSNPIEKSGRQVGNTDVIQWQIDVNKNGSLIREAIVEDSLPDGLTVDPESIQVVRIIQDGDRWVEGEAHPDEESFTKFPIELGTLGQEDAYRIKFKTDVDWEKVNDGDYQKNNGFQNEATLKDGDKELNDDDAKVDIVRDPILRKEGVSNIDYDNKTVTWTIYVNEAGHNIGNVVLTDLIPEGLAITEEDIEIKDEDGKLYPPVDIDIDPNAEGGTALKIDLGNVGTRQLKVQYTTEITNFTINNFKNSVGMTGDGIGEGGENSSAEIKPEGNTYDKSFKGIDYEKKTINWSLSINPRREAINSLVIEDTFPNKGMILLPDSVVVTGPGEDGERVELKKGIDYSLVPREENGERGYHKGFIIELHSSALPLDNGRLIVDYTTSYDPQYVDEDSNSPEPHIGVDKKESERLYINQAKFTGKTKNNNDIEREAKADTRVREDSWNSGKKEGKLVHFNDEGNAVEGWVSGSERKIAWQFYFNYQQQNLGTNVVVTDELQYGGNIDKESIKVSVYDVDSSGETTIRKDSVLDSSNYELSLEGDKFTLTFADGFVIDERYVVEFTTSVPDISRDKYTNKAKVTVDGVDYDYSATLNYDEHDDFLEKGSIGTDGKVFTGDEVDWEVTVNESLSIISEAVITDTISAGHVYLNGSLEIYRLVGTEEVELIEEEDYTLEVVPHTDGNEELTGATNLVININQDLKDTLVLRYTTVVTETEGTIGNSISLDGKSFEQKVVESSRLEARQFSSAGGEWAKDRGALRVTKVDSETEEEINNNEATFTLWYELNGEKVQFGEQEYITENGVLEIGNLPLRTYYLKEVKAPEGYVLSDEEIEIVVDTKYNDNEENIEVGIFKNSKEKIEFIGTKKWQGGENNRPDSIELQLLRDEEDFGDPVTLKAGDTEYTWRDLDRTDIDGNEYSYTVDEVNVPENYTKTVSEDGLIVTNTYVIPKTDITAEKEWIDGPEERPTIWFALYRQIAGGEIERVEDAEIKELANDILAVTWEDLEVTDINGNTYIYSVQEVDKEGNDFQPENYIKAENGLTISNSYVSPMDASAKATKVWKNGPTDRPTIWFALYRQVEGGELEKVPETEAKIQALESGTTEVVWTGLTKTDSFGNEYIFSVKEVDKEGNDFEPENYQKEEDGLTVTNTYIIPKIDITGTKKWDGGPREKPTIELQLFRDGEEYGKPVALEDGETEYIWTDLDKTDINGNEYRYTVDEIEVPENYTKTLSEDGLTITNTYVEPEKPVSPVDPVDPEKEDTPMLPKTGFNTTLSKLLYALGLFTLAVGIVLFRKSRTSES